MKTESRRARFLKCLASLRREYIKGTIKLTTWKEYQHTLLQGLKGKR